MIKPLKAIKASMETTYPKLESRKKLPQILKHYCRHTVISWTAMQSTMIRPNWMYWNTWCTKREISSVCWSRWNRPNPLQIIELNLWAAAPIGVKMGSKQVLRNCKAMWKVRRTTVFQSKYGGFMATYRSWIQCTMFWRHGALLYRFSFDALGQWGRKGQSFDSACHSKRTKSQILLYIIWLLLKFAQIYEVIRWLCTPPETEHQRCYGTWSNRKIPFCVSWFQETLSSSFK